ncbi:MAG: hypothetical protein K2P51_05805 [Rhabdochlamydiaceae bacterium]|nr:hypothetical protein [Rhabdochlamydiaceae bacterium]
MSVHSLPGTSASSSSSDESSSSGAGGFVLSNPVSKVACSVPGSTALGSRSVKKGSSSKKPASNPSQVVNLRLRNAGPAGAAASSAPSSSSSAAGGAKGPYKLKAAPLSESVHMYRKVVGSKRYQTITPEDSTKEGELADLKFTVKERIKKITKKRGATDFSFNIDKGLVTFFYHGRYETIDLFALCAKDRKLEKMVADFNRATASVAGVHSGAAYLRHRGTVGRRGGATPLVRSNSILQNLPKDPMQAAGYATRLHDAQHAGSSPLSDSEKLEMQKNVARASVAYKQMKDKVDAKVQKAQDAFDKVTRPGPNKNKLQETLNHWKRVQSDLEEVDTAALMMGAAYAPQVKTAAAADAQARKLFTHFSDHIDQEHEGARGYTRGYLPSFLPDKVRGKEDKMPLDREYAADVAALPYFTLSPEVGLAAYDAHYRAQGMRAKESGMTGLILGAALRNKSDGIDDAWVKTLPSVIQAEVRAMIKSSLVKAASAASKVTRVHRVP